jgi:hypothetical protein
MRDKTKHAEEISNIINSMALDSKNTGEDLASMHRTLQQNFMRITISFLQKMSESYEDGHYDLRNQSSCELANKIMNSIKEENLYLSHI